MRRGRSVSPPRTSIGSGKELEVKVAAAAIVAVSMATQMERETPAVAGSAAFQALMQAIITCQSTLTEKMDHVHLEIGFICRDMDAFRGCMAEAEQRISAA